jgi:hypothetical protein
LIAKAANSNSVLIDNLEQFRCYLQTLFGEPKPSRQPALAAAH